MKNVMKKSAIWTSIVLFSQLALAGEKVDRELEAGAGDTIEIEHVNGYAKIIGWDKNRVHIEGELDDRAEGLVFERSRGVVKIEVEMPSRFRRINNEDYKKGDNLVIKVPHKSRVSYTSVNAQVEAEKLYKNINLETVNGEVEVEDVKGKVYIESVNGDVSTKNMHGSVRIETVNGDIDDKGSTAKKLVIESINGDIESDMKTQEARVETVNGDIKLDLGKVSRLEMTTVNGTIDAHFDLLNDGDVEVTSVGGKINLTMQKDVSANFEINTHAGGKIINDLTGDKVDKPKYGPSRSLEFSTKEASANVEVESVSGRIHLKAK